MDKDKKITEKFKENLAAELTQNQTLFKLFNLDSLDKSLLNEVWNNNKDKFDEFIDNFYKYFLSEPEFKTYFKNVDIDSLKKRQKDHFTDLIESEIDEKFLQRRIQLGAIHQNVGLSLAHYIGAYHHFSDFINNLGFEAYINDKEKLLDYQNTANNLILFDITLVMKAYTGLSNEFIDNQRRELEKMTKEKGDFSKIFIHDVRNPLNLVYNYSIFLRNAVEKSDFERMKKYADKISAPLERSFKIIDEYFVVNNLEDEILKSAPQNSDLIGLIDKGVEISYPLAQARNIEIEFNPPANKFIYPIIESALEYAIGNIISNAIKFSHDNSKIEIQIEDKNQEIVIKVIDKGIGMLKIDLEHIFNPNKKKSNKPLDGSYASGGWGMYYSKKTIEAHGGSIDIQSEEKKGTTVTLTLPK